MSIGFEDDQLESVRSRMKDLVVRRNVLVHGLIARHDIWSSEGCVAAETYVDDTLLVADSVFGEIREWMTGLEELGRIMIAPEVQELILDVRRELGSSERRPT